MVDQSPKITVIVPVYKVEDYLERCLDSIIAQTYKNLEIIVVNDGSPDGCGEICDRYAKMDDRITVLHQENMGLSMARNNGMKLATGKYVAFVDSDDYIEKEMYESMLKVMLENNLRMVESSMNLSGEFFFEQDPNAFFIQTIDDALERAKYAGFNSAINKLYEYDLIKDIPFKKGKLYEDIIFNSEVWQKLDKIGFVPMGYYVNPQQGESIQRSGYSLKKVEGLWVIHEANQNFMAMASTEKAKETLRSNFMNALLFHFHSLLEVKHLDPDRKNLKKMRKLIKKYSRFKFTNIYLLLINILPLPLYELFFAVNLYRQKLFNQQ
ncbi:glycosyltransferase [Flagellimonas alvinocaridis]|uniref:Glycosyltransferase n=1 Tax=Flagellimonas alvinocaridis TaxID=2530200 RepID=A0A4S8RKF5_9FLAO|nr:glycosyltransferase [Allomuricauda alvinocaridis]THV58111.1 glycosyltransferase [Allomuricauda alvinocaridis]